MQKGKRRQCFVAKGGHGLSLGAFPIHPQVRASRPLNPQAVPGDGTIDLYWDPPASLGGGPISGYLVLGGPDPPATCVPTGPTSCRFSGLTNGEYYDDMFVFAEKSPYFSLISDGSQPGVGAMPRPLPSGPINFAVVSGGGYTVTLSWEAPVDQGALPIVGYQISQWGADPSLTRPDYPLMSVVVGFGWGWGGQLLS